MEVLDSVAHSVRVKPENLRLAEVRVLELESKPWAALQGALALSALQGVRPPTVALPISNVSTGQVLSRGGSWVLLGRSLLRRAAPLQ